MNKYDFINNLQRQLTGKVSPVKLQELTRYYNQYIDEEIRKGKSEEEVLAALGDPRLLAKSIISAEGIGIYNNDEDAGAYGMYEEELSDGTNKYAGFSKKLKTILIVIGIILLIMLLLSTVFRIIRFFLPILIPLLIVWFLIQIWNNR